MYIYIYIHTHIILSMYVDVGVLQGGRDLSVREVARPNGTTNKC